MRFINKLVPIVVLIMLVNTGCASNVSSDVYSRRQTMQAQQVELGTVVATRKVQIEGSQSGVGTVGGAAVGAIAGSAIGGGRGSAIASVLGGIGGLILGSKMEEGVTQTEGQELTIKLETGNTIAIVQAAGEQPFQVGERVRVLSSRDETRVVR